MDDEDIVNPAPVAAHQTDPELAEIQKQLNDFQVPFDRLIAMTKEQAEQELADIKKKIARKHTDDEVDEVLKSKLSSTHLVNRYGVRDPDGTLQDDKTRKQRISYHLKQKFTSHKSVEKLLGALWTDVDHFKKACLALNEIGRQMHTFLTRVTQDHRLKQALSRDLPDLEDKLLAALRHLEQGQCPIVVTGEISAGKSSFLNLLFEGQELELPRSEQETTSCICEIKYGEKRHFVVHRNKPQEGEEETFTIEPGTAEQLQQYVNFEYLPLTGQNRLANKKVEIFVPLEFLRCGLVLVDTPGLTDRKVMQEFVEEYLQHCVAFIYVITNAVNVNRLCRLFQIERQSAKDYLFDDDEVEELASNGMARNTLFIANKWDLVEEEDKMMAEINRKLQKHWLTDSEGQSRVLKLISTKDRDHFRAGYVSERLEAVVDGFKEIAPQNMKLQLRKYYRLLQLVCSRLEYHTQRFLNHALLVDSGRLGAVHANAEIKLEILSKQGALKCSQFEQYIKGLDISDVLESLRDHFKKPEVRRFLTTWTQEECPLAGDKYEIIEAQAKLYVRARFSKVMETWEDETHTFEKKRKTIGGEVRRLLKELDTDITGITSVLTPAKPPELRPPGFQFSFMKMNRTIFEVLQQWFTDTFDVRDIRRKYRFSLNPQKSMEEMAETTLEYLMMGNNIQRLVEKSMGLNQVVQTFKSQVQAEIKNARAEVADLQRKDTAKQFRHDYLPVQKECLETHTKLLHWELEYLFEGDLINSDDIKFSESNYILGSGRATGYYRGFRSVADKQKPVTLKRYAVRDNLRAILGDYKSLKKQESLLLGKVEGMIKFPISDSLDFELAVVMENCTFSLEDWLMNRENLGKHSAFAATNFTLPFSLDISEGLSVLHQQRFVHGDLTPGTIMLTSTVDSTQPEAAAVPRFRAKLYHFGVQKGLPVPRATETPLAPSRYCAPEIISPVGSTRSMDIYSLGQVLSDLWYGCEYRAFKIARDSTTESDDFVQSNADDGSDSLNSRSPSPTPTMQLEEGFLRSRSRSVLFEQDQAWSHLPPPPQYVSLITGCCNVVAKQRPTAKDVNKRLLEISADRQLPNGDTTNAS